MFVRISCQAEKITGDLFKLNCPFPTIYLDNYNYTISLHKICLKITATQDWRNNPMRIWSLRSTCVDKTAVNPQQEIALFTSDGLSRSGYVSYAPVNLQEYKIQNLDVHTSELYLSLDERNLDVRVEKIEILFEIKPYAGIQ